ncbi:MAG: UDP-2-acetamido-2-deoxy-3-oxo-D-glucuronate aminotransferase [Verrucomicrobiae bacterium]|nr:UDP-2-acetamido-2-deoxy-3-oxo-D-glucuronate aminotransferase [Verrucomicrobiae bacterium]
MNVPLFDLKPQYAALQPELEAAVLKVMRETRYILGPEVGELEAALVKFTGAKHAIACSSGSDALLLALMALDIGPGDEVICPTFTFFATAGAIARLGAQPVFVDIDPKTFNIDVAQIQVTPRTKAILPVHLFGQCADMDALLKLGVPVIEDAAQAIGAKYKGRHAGTMGAIGTFSFFPTKNLGGAGDGGALTTNDDKLAARLRTLRVHGSERRYYHDEVGMNGRLDTLQAAVLLVKLRHLDAWTVARQRNAAFYSDRLRAAVTTPWCHPDCTHIYNQYTIRSLHRDLLRAHLTKAGIGSEIYYPVPMHLQQCFRYLDHRAGDFPHAESAASEVLSLPIFPELHSTQLEYVAETIVRMNA